MSADALHRNLQRRQQAISRARRLDLGSLLGGSEYGMEVATFNSARNKKAHLRSATDNQVEQCREEKVDRWRFVGLDKVWPLGKIIAWYINVNSDHHGLGPQATSTARFFLQIKQCPRGIETCMIEQNWQFESPAIEQQILLYCGLFKLQHRVLQLGMDQDIA